MKLGEMVISRAGRDVDRYFVIVSVVNNKYVEIADGDLRKIEDPKLKNKKHVYFTGYVNDELSIWLTEGKRVKNEDLRGIINNYINKEEVN